MEECLNPNDRRFWDEEAINDPIYGKEGVLN